MYRGQPTGWFTTDNGVHVPIFGNETKEQALKRHFGDRNENFESIGDKIHKEKLLKGHEVKETMPKGWSVVEGTMTQPRGYSWISNGKSFFSGEREHALIKNENIK